MQISAFELAVCNTALRTTEQLGQDGRPFPRQLTVDQIEDGVSINKKIKACVKDVDFVDSEIEFSTSEKVLLLALIERSWALDLAEIVVTLKEKLK